jgi:hypothetical protein
MLGVDEETLLKEVKCPQVSVLSNSYFFVPETVTK